MKSQRVSLYFAVVAIFLFAACTNAEYSGGNMLPYVDELLSDYDSEEYLRLSSFNEMSGIGNITVIDNADRAKAFSDYLVSCDLFDNITGTPEPDLLPDFAGEKIVSIADNGNAPYSEMLSEKEALREAAVKSVIATLDTASAAKVSLLTSPFMAVYGMSDIDTLLYVSDCALLVVSPLRLIAAQSRNAAHIGIFADSEAAETDIYARLFGEDKVFVYYCDSIPTMESFMEQYSAQDFHGAFDMIVVDNVNVDVEALRTEIESFFAVENYDNLAVRQMIGTDFKLVDTKDVAAREIYRLMRKGNLFTHAIAYPEKINLETNFRGDYSLFNVQD